MSSIHREVVDLMNKNARLKEQLDRANGLLRYALADYGHPNFTDRHGMADRIRAHLTDEPQTDIDALTGTADDQGNFALPDDKHSEENHES